MSRSAFSFFVSALLHVTVLGALAWGWTMLPERSMRKGEVSTLIVVMAGAPESAPVEIEQPLDSPSTPEQKPQQISPPKSDLPKNNPQLRRDTPQPPATPSEEDAPPPVMLAERQKLEIAPDATPPPPSVRHVTKQHNQPLEATITIIQPVESGAKVDQQPRKLPRNPKPEYPADARAAGLSGRVVLLVSIAADGSVTDARVLQSSGVASLDRSAQTTVQSRWRFEPARSAGVPVPIEVTLGFNFGFEEP